MDTNNFTYKWIDNNIIIQFSKEYSINEWSQMLELHRTNIFAGAKYIIIDFSNVQSMGDMGLESYILRDEFLKKGGENVFIFGCSDQLQNLYTLLGEDNIQNKIKKFVNLEEVINYINQ